MNQSPLARYQQDLRREGFVADAAQAEAVAALDALWQALVSRANQPPSWRPRWLFGAAPTPLKGLYFWGGVGRGKTYLMDLFFESLPLAKKQRTHFHRFMRQVHALLAEFKGQKNPLVQVADTIADQAEVLCFDEFFVSDITDAMLLAGLLARLFERGVCLVTTSNIAPDGLYENGLQREKFLPAIALLHQHTRVLNVDGGVDYRLRALKQARLYVYPLGPDAQRLLADHFLSLTGQSLPASSDVVVIEGRTIPIVAHWEDVAWFDFAALCDGPRSQRDYLVLASEYHTLLLAQVPQMDDAKNDQAKRFIYLIDELYDRGVKLILSAEVAIPHLYVGHQLKFPFERTQSRLLEMQSDAYLASPHKA